MSILNFFEKIGQSISDIFSKIPHEIQKLCSVALGIVAQIEDGLKSNTAVIITNLIPGDWDDDLRKSAIAMCDELIKIMNAGMAAATTEKGREAARQMGLQKLSSDLVALQHGNMLPQNRYDFFTQTAFSKQKPVED